MTWLHELSVLQDLLFHGVMRFYFQDSGQKVATKCIRVASDATCQAVIETLIEKFRADMRMLSLPEYALYEIHENGGKGTQALGVCGPGKRFLNIDFLHRNSADQVMINQFICNESKIVLCYLNSKM